MYSTEELSRKYDDLEKNKPIKLFNRKSKVTTAKSLVRNNLLVQNPSRSFEIK